MERQKFLAKLKKEGKLALVEPSEEIRISYLQKSENCLKSARILFENKLHENSVINSYYSMYNAILALLFNVGIKSENHSASIIILEDLFNEKELAETILRAKEDRIDKQYYVESEKISPLTEESASNLIKLSEEFSLKIRLIINRLGNETIRKLRLDFESRFDKSIKEV